jgi:hypothetical protein
MQSFLRSRVFLYAFLFLMAACLLTTPISIAATGSATCAGGTTVSCSAYRCDCQDNVGCTGYDSSGNMVSSQTHVCSSDSFIPQEDAH